MERVAIVGTGRLARALAAAVVGSGDLELAGVHGRSAGGVREVLASAGAGEPLAASDLGGATIVCVAVSDRGLLEVTTRLAASLPRPDPTQLWVHGSGALGLEVFAPLEGGNRSFATLHPLVSLPPGVDEPLRDAALVASGEPAARARVLAFGRSLGGRPVWIDALDRPMYHAAAALLANGTTALFSAGLELLRRATGQELGAADALALVESALAPLRRKSPRQALTGPVRRGDREIVRVHRAALACARPELLPLYDALMREALRLAREDGLDERAAREVEGLLGGEA